MRAGATRVVRAPKNADRLFVAARGHPYGPAQERGVFRSTDCGKNFECVLFKNENIGAKDAGIINAELAMISARSS